MIYVIEDQLSLTHGLFDEVAPEDRSVYVFIYALFESLEPIDCKIGHSPLDRLMFINKCNNCFMGDLWMSGVFNQFRYCNNERLNCLFSF